MTHCIAVNPAGTRVYVANVNSNTVSVINTVSNAVTTVAAGMAPFGVSVNPEGTLIYVANLNSGTVSVLDATSNMVIHTVTVQASPVAFGQFIVPAGVTTGAVLQ